MASDDLRALVDAAVQRGLAFEEADADSVPIEITNGVLALVQPELDRLTAAVEKLTARSDRCPQCRCDDCNGLLAQHTETGCSCDECVAYPEYACRTFALSERVSLIAQQLGPLLSTHLGEKHQHRCLAVAHAAHHALHAYDYPEGTER